MPTQTDTARSLPRAADSERHVWLRARLCSSRQRIQVIAACAISMAMGHSVLAGPVPRGLDDFTVTTWNESDGLSASRLTAIEQDQDGYLWIGTDVGVLRFDGVRFQPFNRLGETRLPDSPVTTLLSASDRSLWVGIGPGVSRIHGGTITSYGERDGFDSYATSLLEDRTGTIWAGTGRGLLRFDGRRWQHADIESPFAGRAVLAMHVDRAGRFWVATRDAVFRRGAAGGRFEQVEVIGLSSNIWQAFSEDDEGGVWISDFREGFRRVADQRAARQQRGWGVQLIHDRRRNLWVATRGQGLWRVHGAGGRTRTHQVDVITAKDGLANDAIQCVYEDREGNIWVGTHAGLQRLTPHKVTPVTDLPIARGTSATPDGSVWVGTTAGLTRISAAGRRHYQEQQGLPGIVVLALYADPQGTLWVATEGGLARFADERFTLIRKLSGEQRVFSIATSDGSVWVRDVSSRLRRLADSGEELPIDEIPGVFQTTAMTLSADRAGRLWIGARGGRLGVRDPGGAFRSFDPGIGSITAIFEDSIGTMWFGGEAGLSRLANGEFLSLTRKNGLPSSVNSIVDDDKGDLWLGLRTGIARLEKEEIARAAGTSDYRLHYRLFNSADGAAGVPVTEGSRTAARGRDGRLWFATSGGVTVVDPENIGASRPPVPVQIEAVLADAKRFDPVTNLRLPARTSHVQFAFTALTLTDSAQVQFQYRLDGVDDDWVDAGTTRQTSYTNLSPGPYRFQLRGGIGDGVWSAQAAALDFSIPPMFYQTGWFYALCFVVAFSAVYGSWRLHARHVRRQFALVLAERIRMSRAIHDTLLQGLAGLALQLDDLSHGLVSAPPTLRERVLHMRRRVEDAIRDARQSIWDLRSPESRPLPEALRDVGQRVIDGRPIALDMLVTGTPQRCSSRAQEQLLLICQEALTNAVQHGQPTHVGVDLEYCGNAVRVRVRDDGCGFDPGALDAAAGHYGVISMKERAAQVRGSVTIASTPGEGTQVEAVVPSV
ncbi:MAG TPA: two-component regulator propeller domain-containing protein [Vicinamibacterales bacterium]|nr:two-component regulator propeller domain-containing protein [Vicinamibacterales bacterium]